MELESKEPTTLNLRTVRQFFDGGDAVLRGIAAPAGDLILAHALAKMATSPGGILKSEISTEQACWIPCSLHSPLYVETSILQVRIRKF